LKVTNAPVDKLIPYASNSRTHSDEQIAQIAASIREFGFTNPVLVDGANGIIAGHGRVLAARKLGMKNVPTIELSHLTETQRKAYIIADNKLALNAGWDMDLLPLEMGGLLDEGFDLSLIGFDDDEITSTISLTAGEETENDPDDEWVGMPEFTREDTGAFKSVIVHFKDKQAVEMFEKELHQTITENTRMIWYPEIEIETYADKVYD